MPAYISIDRLDFYYGAVVSDEDADYASTLVDDIQSEDCHTETTLAEHLESLTTEIAGLRIGCVFRDEEGDIHGMTVADGAASIGSPGPVRRMRKKEAPDARPANRECSASYAKVRDLEARARAAVADRDQTAVLSLLAEAPIFPDEDAPSEGWFQQIRIDEARRSLWRWLMERKKPAFTFDHVLNAFETERDDVAHAIAYALFRIPSFAKPLADAAETATHELVKERCAKAINEWPDFPFVKGKPAEATPKKEEDDPKAPYDAAAIIRDLTTSTLKTLDDPSPGKFRKVLRAISRYGPAVDELRDEVLNETAAAFLPLLKEEQSERARSFAIELLIALGVPHRELGGYLVGLPRSAWVREIELEANYDLFGSLSDAQVSEQSVNAIVKKPWPGDAEIVMRPPCELRPQGAGIVSFTGSGTETAVRWSDPTVLEGLQQQWSDLSWQVKDDRVCLLAGKKIILYDRETGRRILDVATPLRKAVLPHAEGFLVWDGRNVLGEPVESGLIVKMNGETRDVIAPLVNKSVVRTCAGVELDFSRKDVIRRQTKEKEEEERLRWKDTIYQVAGGGAGAKTVAIRYVAFGDVIDFDPTSAPVAAIAPTRDAESEQAIDGIDFDSSSVASAADRAMVEAEIAGVGDGVHDFINWFSDLAKAFPRASFQIATKDWNGEPRVNHAANGKIDYTPRYHAADEEKKEHARVVEADKRRKKKTTSADTKALPESYQRFATARKAWRASWKEGLEVSELMGLLGDPAFSPTEPSSLMRLANGERIRMYELVVRSTPSNKPPTREVVAAIERESDDVHWRISGAWAHHARAREALLNAALSVESPILKERLRRASGYFSTSARPNERTNVLSRALAKTTTTSTTTLKNATEISVQIDRALAEAKERLERHQKTKLPNATEAIAASDEASRNRDVNAMLKALDDDALWSKTAVQQREWLWSEIIRTPRKFLSFERVLRALSEERDACAHRITYKLYVQTHFAKRLASAVNDLETRKPEGSDLLLRRLKSAIADWPDFPTDQREVQAGRSV